MVKQLQYEDLSKNLRKNPYSSICSWAESKVKLTGKEVFQIVSLQPISLIMPPIPCGDNNIRQNIHVLLFSPPGSGKTTMCKMFEDISYNPFPYESITSAKLEEELFGKNNISMMAGDIARIFKDEILIKTLEGILGEGRVSRLTMQKTRQFDVNAIFFGAGLPENITRCIRRGFLQRVFPLIIFHTKDQRRKIVDNIINQVGLKKIKGEVSSEDIKNYYKLLWEYQKKDDRIGGYIFENSFKDKINEKHSLLEENLPFPDDLYLIREAHSAFRYLCSSAMINLFNRKIEINNGIKFIRPNKEDLDLAMDLFEIEMRMKSKILTMDKMLSGTKDVLGLYNKIVNDENLDIVNKKIAESMIKGRKF